MTRLVPLLAVAAVVVWCVTLVLYLVGLGHSRACTWGASSVGPIVIRDGHVSGSLTPHVSGCRP